MKIEQLEQIAKEYAEKVNGQTRQAIDVSTAMKIYESKGLQDIGKQVMSQRAGATKIVVENKTETAQVKE